MTPWTRHVRTGAPLLRRVFDAAQQVGDLTYAAYSYIHLIPHLLASGDPLGEVQCEAEVGLGFVRQVRFGHAVKTITAQLQLVRTLRGLTPRFGWFDDAGFNEEQFERHFEEDPRLAVSACRYWIRKLQARLLPATTPPPSLRRRMRKPLWVSVGFFEQAEYHFYAALTRAALCDAATAAERASTWRP